MNISPVTGFIQAHMSIPILISYFLILLLVSLLTSYLAFGVYMLFGNPNHGYYKGFLDDVRIYNRALSPVEISTIYGQSVCSDTHRRDTTVYYISSLEFESISPVIYSDSTNHLFTASGGCDSIVQYYSRDEYMPADFSDTIRVTVYDTVSSAGMPTEDLVSYYPFNGNASDLGSSKNDGIVQGATLTTDKEDNENSAYYFDGVDDYILIPDRLHITNNFTISFWAYHEKPSGYANILSD